MDILVDVGGVYSPQAHRYDHHQREFTDSFNEGFDIRLSSAGLIYKHFGQEVVKSLVEEIAAKAQLTFELKVDNSLISTVYLKLYEYFILTIDAVDNGIDQYP